MAVSNVLWNKKTPPEAGFQADVVRPNRSIERTRSKRQINYSGRSSPSRAPSRSAHCADTRLDPPSEESPVLHRTAQRKAALEQDDIRSENRRAILVGRHQENHRHT